MLRKESVMSWTEKCQKAFDKIKEYLSKPPMLVPQKLERPLLLYLSVLDGAFGCVLRQHDETGRKEQEIYCLNKKFTPYKASTLCWSKTVKGQALADHLVENPIDGEYEQLKMYFPNEEVSFIGEDIAETYDCWRMFLTEQQTSKEWASELFWYQKLVNTTWYLPSSDLIKRFINIAFTHVPRIQNEFAYALATLSSMIQHPDKNLTDLIPVEIHKQPSYFSYVEEEFNRNSWFHDIKEYLEKGEYPVNATLTQKCTLRRVYNHFFQSGGMLYRRTPDLGLLRSVDAKETSRLLEEIHVGT
uniref:Uncharacterized protein LOC104231103 n=1 Tax=Nicotiana sylvestris TaxID=4096 RepID=A0A1U7WYF1_NICSY|nr:PREDICTED: uncharacterized protein LOC104231103 [Nicotiana sylvestris]